MGGLSDWHRRPHRPATLSMRQRQRCLHQYAWRWPIKRDRNPQLSHSGSPITPAISSAATNNSGILATSLSVKPQAIDARLLLDSLASVPDPVPMSIETGTSCRLVRRRDRPRAQDRAEAAIGRAELHRVGVGSVEACPVVLPGEAEDAHAGPETKLRLAVTLHDHKDEAVHLVADLAGLPFQPGVGSLYATAPVRRRMRATLAWCQAHGHIEHNIAGEAIDGALPAQPSVKQHLRAPPYRDVAEALTTVDSSRASPTAKLCLWFTVLTVARSGETRGATWAEIDLETRECRIPANRMKSGVEHSVPLSDAAMAVLQRALPLRNHSDLIFPSPARRARPLSTAERFCAGAAAQHCTTGSAVACPRSPREGPARGATRPPRGWRRPARGRGLWAHGVKRGSATILRGFCVRSGSA